MKGKNFNISSVIMLWLTSAIWGFAFVAQKAGMEFIGPFTFNGIRFALGGIVLLPLAFLQRRKVQEGQASLAKTIKGGVIAGLILFSGASLQQAGIIWTTAGKAGFITGLYVILVPVIGMFIGQAITRNTWIGAIMAVIGLYLLSISGNIEFQKGDILVLASSFFWAAHVQLINRLVITIKPILLSIIQFATCSFLSLVIAGIAEPVVFGDIVKAGIPLLYGGLMSVGIAYTLQVVAQRHVNPAFASIILSFETVFAALGGWILLNESLTTRNIIGCSLMFFGIVTAQIRINRLKGLYLS